MSGFYAGKTPTAKVSVLGTSYDIYLDITEKQDPLLNKCDGYTDKTVKRIVVANKAENCDLDDWAAYRKQVLRHELIHAFMFESGFTASKKWDVRGEEHSEELVDWIAMQYPKMLSAFRVAGAI